MKKDDVIETTNQVQNEWLQFEYNGKTAYVHVPFLTGTAPVIEKQETTAPLKLRHQLRLSAPVAQAKPAQAAVKAAETSTPSGGRELTVVATAYTAHPSENGGIWRPCINCNGS